MFLWDHDFHASPEDRHRRALLADAPGARIVFSLSFHLGKMTPKQAIDFLVDTVDFERANAEAEVRRSFTGAYSPLYQAGYMLGGLQLRALYRELVDFEEDDDSRVPRRDPAGRSDADRDGARTDGEHAPHTRRRGCLALRRRAAAAQTASRPSRAAVERGAGAGLEGATLVLPGRLEVHPP